jgi:hypothetical protein
MVAKKRRDERPPVSLIVLTYNGKDDTLAFLESLGCTDYPNYEIMVVDNGSTDGTVEAVRKSFPKAKVVENGENLGFAGGMNAGVRKSRGKYVVLLNNDMIASKKEWLSLLVDAAEADEDVGIAIPMVLYYGTNVIESLGKVVPDLLTKITATTALLGHNEKDKRQFNEKIEIAAGNGLVRREVFDKIGFLDERMFVYFEETDFSYRARRRGYKIICDPRSKIWHRGSATIEEGSYFAVYHSYKNKIRFILRNYDPVSKILALSFNSAYYIFLVMSYALKRRPDLSKAVIDGIVWNCKNWKDYA